MTSKVPARSPSKSPSDPPTEELSSSDEPDDYHCLTCQGFFYYSDVMKKKGIPPRCFGLVSAFIMALVERLIILCLFLFVHSFL